MLDRTELGWLRHQRKSPGQSDLFSAFWTISASMKRSATLRAANIWYTTVNAASDDLTAAATAGTAHAI